MSTESSIQQQVEAALAHHQAGRIAEAEAGYRAALQGQPDNADALHLLGLLNFQRNQHALALDLIRKAIRVRPDSLELRINLGKVLAGAGMLDALRSVYAQAATDLRGPAELHHAFGVLLGQLGATQDSARALQRAIAAQPNHLEASCALTELYLASGPSESAAEAARHVISIQPQLPGAHVALALALLARNHYDAALPAIKRALELDPNNAMAMRLMAVIDFGQGRPHQAIEWVQRGLRSDPNLPELHCTLGSVLVTLGQSEQAIQSFRRALELRPAYPEALHDLGFALQHIGRLDDAIVTFRRAIEIRPDWGVAHHALGHALLIKGDYRAGFPEYDWRYRTPELGVIAQKFPVPMWDGADVSGRTILIHAEQGFGDTIHFARYAPMVAQRGARVILQCQPELHSLLKSMPGISVIARGQPLPPFDLHCPLMSLPRVFGTTLETIPSSVPYLAVDHALAERAREALRGLVAEERVGLVWAGGPRLMNDSFRSRSVPLSALEPILRVPGITFISLQTGDAADEISSLPHGITVVQPPEPLTDFAQTAALMQHLDLIITADTAAAHLAGALGRPTWILIPHFPDWRWALNRSDCPWYPTARLFRADGPSQWANAVRQISEALAVKPG